jgi:GAF domain-containing protein
MSARWDRAGVRAIWLLIAAGAVQPFLWRLPGGLAARPALFTALLILWAALLVFAALATHRAGRVIRALRQREHAHETALSELEQLRTQNAMLDIIARSVDVPLAFQELASRIERLVPCDRVGLALLSDDGREFNTFTPRADDGKRRQRSLPEVSFKAEGTVIGNVVRSREPFITGDIREMAADHIDANVVAAAGFHSALIVPLISTDRAVGTLSAVSRRRNAFDRVHVAPLQPIAEILAVAWVAQQLQVTLGRSRTLEAVSELTLTVAAEIGGALQAVVDHCDRLAQAHPGLERDVAGVVLETQRIAEHVERMRAGAHEHLEQSRDSTIGPGGQL